MSESKTNIIRSHTRKVGRQETEAVGGAREAAPVVGAREAVGGAREEAAPTGCC